MEVKKGLEKVTNIGIGFVSTVGSKVTEFSNVLEERGKEYMTKKGKAQIESLKEELSKIGDQVVSEYKKIEEEIKKVVNDVAETQNISDIENNTINVLKSDVLDNFVKEHKEGWNNEDWLSLISKIELVYGPVDRQRIGLTLEKLKVIL